MQSIDQNYDNDSQKHNRLTVILTGIAICQKLSISLLNLILSDLLLTIVFWSQRSNGNEAEDKVRS